jgi:hypothetical protein
VAHHEEFFLTLNTEDIRELREVLERAEGKAETLKNVFHSAGMTYLGPEGN